MKLIYIIGPYRSSTERAVVENIRRAESVALDVWRAGFACICPHLNTALFGGACPDEVWLQGDLEILSRCDGAVTVTGWEKSKGSCAEVSFCENHGIPVFRYISSAVDWFKREEMQKLTAWSSS